MIIFPLISPVTLPPPCRTPFTKRGKTLILPRFVGTSPTLGRGMVCTVYFCYCGIVCGLVW